MLQMQRLLKTAAAMCEKSESPEDRGFMSLTSGVRFLIDSRFIFCLVIVS